MECPWCHSTEAEETGAFDSTNVELSTCNHDFQCRDCKKYFVVEYIPIKAKKIILDSEEVEVA